MCVCQNVPNVQAHLSRGLKLALVLFLICIDPPHITCKCFKEMHIMNMTEDAGSVKNTHSTMTEKTWSFLSRENIFLTIY